jgi:hypothetical protein
VSRARRELLQWFGLFGGALAWTANAVFGYGLTEAACAPSGSHWGGIWMTPWQIGMTVGLAAIVLAAEAASVILFLDLRHEDEYAPGPIGRMKFFATAALLGNVLFLGATLMQGVGAAVHSPCIQA